MRALFLIISLFFTTQSFSHTTCGRSAIINGRPHLIDISSSKKGEGLRFYLEKDQEAKDLLNQYQDSSKPRFANAVIGTVGSAMLLIGLGKSKKIVNGEWEQKQKAFVLGGLSLILLNVLIVNTVQHNNEGLLLRSIEEYNKRNFPKIYLSPFIEEIPGENKKGEGFTIGFIEEF